MTVSGLRFVVVWVGLFAGALGLAQGTSAMPPALQAPVAAVPGQGKSGLVAPGAGVAAGRSGTAGAAGAPDAGAGVAPLVPLTPFPTTLPEAAPVKRVDPASVTLGGHAVFPITAAFGPFSPKDRATLASRRLAGLTADAGVDPASVQTVEREGETDIVSGDEVVTTVTDADSDTDAVGRTRVALAADHVSKIRAAIAQVRDEHSTRSLTVGALKALAATVLLVVLLIGLRLLFRALYRWIERRRGTQIRGLRIQAVELISEQRIVETAVQAARLLRFAVTALLLYIYIPILFECFPATRGFGHQLIHYVVEPIALGARGFVGYLPRLLVLLIIVFFAWQANKLARFLFTEVERGTLEWPGFYPEWAMPTYRIVELLLGAFALVVMFPYLPGSNSAAFKGVSIFLGVLFSLGSSSAIANVVAGVLLTYTRAFKVGDRVSIADTNGDVIEKTLLATHVRTIKNVDVTVPNSLVLASHIINYSRSSEEKPLILNTRVTIGYDVPWRTVHELLKGAALKTEGVLAEPKPYVLQTALNDFYVEYEVNAATALPASMVAIYSELYGNILDAFNEAGVEVMSPHYTVMRSEETTTVPAAYLGSAPVRESPRHPKTARE